MKKKSFASSRRGLQRQAKNADIMLSDEIIKETEKLKGKKPNLSDPDAPEITNWENAVVGKFYRPIKKQITIRLDADILDWFKHAAEKYQPLINDACREYIRLHSKTKNNQK